MEKYYDDELSDMNTAGMIVSAMTDGPYFKLLKSCKPSKRKRQTFGNKVCCHLCGETGVTLHKKELNGETVYICQDCKLTEALLEDEE